MSYSPQLVISPWNSYFVQSSGLGGVPTTCRYLLYSVVVCLPGTATSIVNFSNSVAFGGWSIDSNKVTIRLIPAVSTLPILDAWLNHDAHGVRTHLLLSVDTVAQILQVYVNDVPLSITSGAGWTGSGPCHPGTGPVVQWTITSAGSATGTPGGGPGVADVWFASPASFFDLSVTANRRKFIKGDLSLVDLGVDGSEPLGTAPPIFLTVRPGDTNADHFKANNGTGGAWTASPAATPITFEPGGACTIPSKSALSMDDVYCFREVEPEGRLVFLEWSDDRGRSFGNPVSQPIGERGEYLTSPQWQRLGLARDRVFRISWSVPVRTALQGAWIEVDSRAKS